jgi:hypothetical protein
MVFPPPPPPVDIHPNHSKITYDPNHFFYLIYELPEIIFPLHDPNFDYLIKQFG